MSGKQESKQESTPHYTDYQIDVMNKMLPVYGGYVGAGTLGGLSDLEKQALGSLRSADVWGPLTRTGTGLLSGDIGAKTLSPEMAMSTFKKSVATPTIDMWKEDFVPSLKEEYAGPGYWHSDRPTQITKSAEDVAKHLGSEQAGWMWNVEQANRAIEEAKAGRALSALGAYPSSLLGWASGISGIGRQAQSILNQITDPQVLQVLNNILGTSPSGKQVTKGEQTPSDFQQMQNWYNFGRDVFAPFAFGGGGYGYGGY